MVRDDEERAAGVMFSGAALKAKVLNVFDLGDDQGKSDEEGGAGTDLGRGGSSFGRERAGVGASATAKIAAGEDSTKIGKIARQVAQKKDGKDNKKTSIVHEEDEEEDRETSKGAAVLTTSSGKASKKRSYHDMVKELAACAAKPRKESGAPAEPTLDSSGNDANKPKKKPKPSNKNKIDNSQAEPSTEKLPSGILAQGILATSAPAHKLKEDKSSSPKQAEEEPRRFIDSQGVKRRRTTVTAPDGSIVVRFRKKTKTRSKQKNKRKDTRPEGSWKKSTP